MDANVLIAVLVIALLAVAGWLLLRKRQSERLEKSFGPEYNRAMDELGSRGKAEAELRARQKRVEQLHIVPLSPAEASHFSQAWKSLQARFVDDPHRALGEADQLVGDLMQKRGYPMGDFERSAADVSVDHPLVVEHYRAGHAIALRDRDAACDTETLRQALVHYRALFAELLEVRQPEPVRERESAREPRVAMPRGEHAMAQREPLRSDARERELRDRELRDKESREREIRNREIKR
jgi:hypothetical protein